MERVPWVAGNGKPAEALNSKFQDPTTRKAPKFKSQTSNSEGGISRAWRLTFENHGLRNGGSNKMVSLELGIWLFSGGWMLEFGICRLDF
jgi:hypothetical protein